MPRRITLTPEQERRFRQLWLAGAPVARIAVEFGLTCDSTNRVRSRLQLRPRTPQNRAAPTPPEPDPTPEQIEERAATIKAGWSPETEIRRRVASPAAAIQALCYPDDVFGPYE